MRPPVRAPACIEGGGGITCDPPAPRPLPRPPPSPWTEGGGGTMFEADADRDRPPPAPPVPSTEGGGATTWGAPLPNAPARPAPVPETLGGGGTTGEPFPPDESPKRVSIFRTKVCRVGGGAITAAPGEPVACPAETPPRSGGGAVTEVCRVAPARPAPFTSGGGATTDDIPAGSVVDLLVADNGTLGATGLDEGMSGRAIAVLRSGGTTSPPGRRASRATSSGR